MLLKWMVAEVPAGDRDDFAEAQRGWAPIALAQGLIGQVGGWNQEGAACMLAAWSDAGAYKRFYDHVHDAITDFNEQQGTYVGLHVALAHSVVAMPGDADSFADAMAGATFLRLADCNVHNARVSHFVRAQLTVWAPGMAACEGMLGGRFSASVDRAGRYLVSTLWRDEADHQAYVNGPFTGLRDAAGASIDLASIKGHRVALDPTWTIRGVA